LPLKKKKIQRLCAGDFPNYATGLIAQNDTITMIGTEKDRNIVLPTAAGTKNNCMTGTFFKEMTLGGLRVNTTTSERAVFIAQFDTLSQLRWASVIEGVHTYLHAASSCP
jgi:hypothetical protein